MISEEGRVKNTIRRMAIAEGSNSDSNSDINPFLVRFKAVANPLQVRF